MSRTNKKYTPEFKTQVVETRINKQLTFSETTRLFEIFKIVNGYQYPNVDIIKK